MIAFKEYNGDDEVTVEKYFSTIEELIHFLMMEDYFEDFDYLEEDDVIEGLEKNKKFVFGGGYTNVHITME